MKVIKSLVPEKKGRNVFLVEYNGARWVWKASPNPCRNAAELLAYSVSQLMNYPIVPNTILAPEKFEGITGTLQQYIDGIQSISLAQTKELFTAAQLEKMAAFDFALNCQDRGGIMKGNDGNMYLIDNAGTFWSYPVVVTTVEYLIGKQLMQGTVEFIDGMHSKMGEITNLIKKCPVPLDERSAETMEKARTFVMSRITVLYKAIEGQL